MVNEMEEIRYFMQDNRKSGRRIDRLDSFSTENAREEIDADEEGRKNLSRVEACECDNAKRDAGICFLGSLDTVATWLRGYIYPYGPQNINPC